MAYPQQKNILFFSPRYDYCKEIVQSIVQKGLRDQFIFVDIDQHRTKLPDFVDRVPFVVTGTQQHYTDEMVRTYINHLSTIYTRNSQRETPPQQAPTQTQTQTQGDWRSGSDTEPAAYSFGVFQPNSVTVTDYSSVMDDSLMRGFPYMSDANQGMGMQQQHGAMTDPEKSTKGDRIPDALYQNYISQRENDEAAFKKLMPRMA